MEEIATPRLRLRAFAPGDEEAVHRYAGDPEVCRHVTWGPNSPEDTRRFVADAVRAARHDGPPDSWTWAVVLDADLVGSVALTVRSRGNARGEMGYVLRRDRWGQGITTEAAAVVLGFALTRAGLARVEATCRPENSGSRRVLEKIGMQHEGLLRSHVVVAGERRDSLLFAAVR
ncbi:GNAT family N-acetyltransferase [Kineococcus endophyticus]|uniref:GNAT family N-acetyltransferase n=1 Tax=Kineococcus endophyticus TaxID=1181883 RepID=A0ABV3P2V8_9ACTN